VAFPTRHAWEDWLDAHHADSRGLWLRFAKKGSGEPSVTHAEALETALCFGWIDGQTARLDDRFFLQRFTPRGPRSKWSRINRESAAELARLGRVRPAGLAELERAQADGRWDAAYEPPSTIQVPDDLQRALEASPAAAEFFAGLDSRNRYAVLYRIHDAKRPDTRARRIETFVALLAEGKKLHP
jgi:uncharacterized protein YdeI (YjbR/CyaY-like superfamily)